MRNLRRALASIALSVPLTGCPYGGCPDNKPIEETIALPAMPDADLATMIASCKQQQDCEPLCAEIFMRQHGTPASSFPTCELTTDAATGGDAVHYIEQTLCIGGRRPHGYRRGRPCGLAVAAYLAQQAELEAASVRAFADLHADLVQHAAPASLRRAAIAAAADEVRHARTCAGLARRHGITPVFAPVAAAPRRSRRELAIENAVEGCVRETYGAVLAGFQARAAGDPAIRRAMRGIARDEAKHAALSWRLHRWLAPQLDARERRAVEDALRFARAELAPVADDPEVHRVAGLPEPAAANALLAALDAQVWS